MSETSPGTAAAATPGQADEPLFTAWRAVADEIEEGPYGGDQYNAGHVYGLRWCADQIEAAIAAQQPQPAPELAAAMRETRELRERMTQLADNLDAVADGQQPSKASEIRRDAARRIRKALEQR